MPRISRYGSTLSYSMSSHILKYILLTLLFLFHIVHECVIPEISYNIKLCVVVLLCGRYVLQSSVLAVQKTIGFYFHILTWRLNGLVFAFPFNPCLRCLTSSMSLTPNCEELSTHLFSFNMTVKVSFFYMHTYRLSPEVSGR